MNAALRNLVEVLEEAKRWLARADNDFVWSGFWENAEEALAELSNHIQELAAGRLPEKLDLDVLFGPTGPIQEVSLSSGWGEEFLMLAKRFDAASEVAYR